MCVAAVAWLAHPRWRLVAIGNRDEFHDRPAAPLARWDDGSGIIAGRDLRSGGTWLGLGERSGRFALVTNVRGQGVADPSRASRGTLVTDVLAGTGRYANPDGDNANDFNAFNLVVTDQYNATFLTNRPEPVRTELTHGVYGLSNGALDEPWPKTLQLKAALLDWLGAGADDFASLFNALRSEARPLVGLHPRQPSDVAIEPAETGPFIADPVYGTRCSTVVAIDRAGRATIAERRFNAAGATTGETRLTSPGLDPGLQGLGGTESRFRTSR